MPFIAGGFSQFLKYDFQTMSKNELEHRAGPSDLDSCKPNGTCEFQSDEITDLSLCAHSTEFTWKITECFNLPENEGYFIDSTEFSFANATWCLRMYPNGKKGDSTGRMQLLLVRLNSCNLEHRIHYRLGLDKFNNRKYGSFTHVVTFHANAVEMGILNLLTRSDIIQRKKSFAQDDILTAFCEMFLIEEVQVLSNNRQLLKTSSEFQSLEGSKMTQQLPVQSTLLDPDIYIWKITNFFELPLDEDYFIDSTEFSVANATWCMRMYPNGHRGCSSGWIHLMLVRLHSCNSEHQIHYRLGLKTRRNTEHETLTHVVTVHTNTKEIGVVNLLKRTTMYSMRKWFAQDDNVTIFCHISLIEETKVVCSNETKELQPSSKSQSVDISEHSQHLYLKSTLSSQENLTWKVTNFFLLPMYKGYCVESAEFSFANATWCLRMYPNGQMGASSGYIQLLLVRLHHSYNSEHRIQYRLGLMAPRDKEHGCLPQVVIFSSNAEEMGIVNIMKRSDIIKSRKRLVPYDILTVFCKICMIEEIMLSNQMEVIEASSTTELVMDTVIDLKQDKNNTSSFDELNSSIQKIGSKEDEIDIDDLDFTVLKKKIRNDQLETECHVEEIKVQTETGTKLFMDNVIDLKQDKNNTSSFSKLKSNIQEISSEDDGKVMSKTLDELEKKKLSDDQFEMEKREAELGGSREN